MRTGNDPKAITVICTPDSRKLALAFVGRLRAGVVITDAMTRDLPDAVQVQIVWALSKHGLTIENEFGGFRVVKRAA